MNLTEDLVRLRAIEDEAARLGTEAKKIPPGAENLELARLSAIEDAMAMLLAEAQTLHARVQPEIERLTAEAKAETKTRLSISGIARAFLRIGGTVVGFVSNPLVVLVIVLALFFHATQISLS